MKLVLASGRTVFELTHQRREHINSESTFDYTEPGAGGHGVDIIAIYNAMKSVQADFPSAKPVGMWPQVELLCDCMAHNRPCPPL